MIEFIFGLHTIHYQPEPPDVPYYEFNTKNELVAVATDHFVIGRMINTYRRESYILGIKDSYSTNRLTFDYGVMTASGYPKGYNKTSEQIVSEELVWSVTPLLTAKYNITPNFSVNLMSQGLAVNIGVSLKFD